jgi:group II intron reverse transcriptase/maturase
MYFSQIHVNLFSLKKVTSLPGVAANQSGGKASGDGGLRLPETILSMVTMRNLLRYAGTSLSTYWSSFNNGHVARWLRSCVQGLSQENTGTALQKEDYIAQEPKLNGLKNRKNLRTTGFNLYKNLSNKGKRSVHSTLSVKEGMQTNRSFVGLRWSFSTNIRSNNLDERVLVTELKQMVEKCKNKDGRYGNLIQIIGSFSTVNLAYLMVKSNPGISAKGVSNEILDGIDLKTLQKISKDILGGTIKFSPVRRVLISKSGKSVLRPLGVNSPREKIVQKAIDLVLTAIFEEIFLDCNHGSRLNSSCHSALKYLQLKIGNASTYSWVIEGDIKGCFDNILHSMILKKLRRRVDCPATINLIKRILSAGYILNEDLKKVGRKKAKVRKSNIGIPQGIVLSPLFSNIVLHELDVFVEDELKLKFIRGKQRLKVYSKDIYGPNFRRLYYVRYVDDWVILVAGSFKEAKVIRDQVSNKLKSLGLTLNLEKTHITSLRDGKCRFLGIDFFIRKNDDKHHKPTTLVKKNNITIKQRFSPRIILYAPILELIIKLKDKGFVKKSRLGEFFPIGKSDCISLTHPQIINYFNSRIRGILNYYSCVYNRNELRSIVRFLNYSCALTLARKYKLKSLAKTFKRFGRDLKFVNEKGKEYKIFRPVNLRMLSENKRFRVNENTKIDQLLSQSWPIRGTLDNIEIHHIKSVKDVRVKARTYTQWVGGFRRKSILLCKEYHRLLHVGKLTRNDINKLSKYKVKLPDKKN